MKGNIHYGKYTKCLQEILPGADGRCVEKCVDLCVCHWLLVEMATTPAHLCHL